MTLILHKLNCHDVMLMFLLNSGPAKMMTIKLVYWHQFSYHVQIYLWYDKIIYRIHRPFRSGWVKGLASETH